MPPCEVTLTSRSCRWSSAALALSSSWLDAQSGLAGRLGVCASAPPEWHGLAATAVTPPPPPLPAGAAPAAPPPPAGVPPTPLAQLVLNLAGLGSADEESGSAPASVAPPEELSCDACDALGVCCEAREGEGVCAVLFFAEGSYDPADSVLFSSRGRFGAASRWLEYIPEAAVAAVRP